MSFFNKNIKGKSSKTDNSDYKIKTSKILLYIVLGVSILVVAQGIGITVAELIKRFLLNLIGSEAAIISGSIGNIVSGILYLSIVFLLMKILVKKIIKSDMENFFMGKISIKPRWIVTAIVLPVAVKLIYLLGFDGQFMKSSISTGELSLIITEGVFLVGIAAGFAEEMIFRGFILNLVKYKWGVKVAVVVPSVIFGAIHIIGASLGIPSMVLLTVSGTMVGIMFSLIALESKSVFCSGIVHCIWNILFVADFFSIGVVENPNSIFNYVLRTKSFLLTGGDFGVEASIISVCAYLIVSVMAFIFIKANNKLKTE